MHYRETDGSVLILTPAQLAKQWQGELASKFGLEFICNYDDEFAGFDAHDQIITSIDTAKSDRHQETVLARDWDVLVMDEAHYVKNQGDRSVRSRRRPHLRLCFLPDGDARPERTRGPL